MGILVKEYHVSPHDAWNCTLREFCIITHCKDKKAIRQKVDETSNAEILEFFEMRELANAIRI